MKRKLKTVFEKVKQSGSKLLSIVLAFGMILSPFPATSLSAADTPTGLNLGAPVWFGGGTTHIVYPV